MPGEGTAVPKLAGDPSDLIDGPGGRFAYRVAHFPLQHRHGAHDLHLPGDWQAQTLTLLTGDAGLEHLDPRGRSTLDTETTGLSGGAGVFVYMVGLARFVPDGVEVWQGFLRGPEQEAALLDEVRERIAEAGAVVSFFGKSFDRHRLEDKMALHGIASPFEGRPHLDLFHPLRRLYKDLLENTKLQTMERALCQVQRADDLPGRFAPEAWFDYLGGRAHRLHGVFQHNLDDVLSLITLTHELGRLCVCSPAAHSPARAWAQERALATALMGQGAHAQALDRLRATEAQHGPDGEGTWLAAQILARIGPYDQAVHDLARLQGAAPIRAVQALTLASKVAEHRLKDPGQAHDLAQRALTRMQALRAFSGRTSIEKELSARIQRLSAILGPQ
ncbi:MAG: ribonuclease H-like domain-containing protein [Planctomycetota bacterium]